MDLAVVGAGRVGTAIAVRLRSAGHRVVAASGRSAARERVERHLPGVPFVPSAEAVVSAEVVLLGVPDDSIASVAEEVVPSLAPGAVVGHLSGAASLETLGSAEAAGHVVCSVHPLQTFPDVETGIERLPGSAVAVTARDEAGYGIGEALAGDAGGRPFRLPDERKPLYHAAAVFCSNYLAAVEGVAERLLDAAGIADPLGALAPLARASLDHVLDLGPDRALTGPAVRGDAGTVRRNLEALSSEAPELVAPYVVLARASLDLAERAGRLRPDTRGRVEEVLAEWR